ncbi:UvrD-helicase domain-containing protein [Nitrobacter sp.]|uniref:UvrD-helicase domain-containing protein n=1 Tax=Nitrobacter sp. TaxID=29420 RepID=UPI00399D65EF
MHGSVQEWRRIAGCTGLAGISGSAGTGKTVVALHRAANILRQHRQARLLLTTFSLPLAKCA